MKVDQVTPEKKPWLFNPAFDTGEVDGDGNPVCTCDCPHLEDTVASGKRLRKKAKDGHEQSCHVKDDASVDVYYDDDLVATWQIIPQYWRGNSWRDYTKIPTALTVTPEGRLQCSGEQGGFSWNIDIGWTRGDSKWTIHVVAPGVLFRFKWNVVFTALGQQLIADGTLKLGYEDYPGDTDDDQGVVERNIIFEPLGVNDELIVDPYLSVDEQASYIWIECDGYSLRCSTDGGVHHIRLNTPGYRSTLPVYGDLRHASFRDDSSVYWYFIDDSNRVVTLLENTTTRVCIKVAGNFYNGTTEATWSDSVVEYWYFYPDCIIKHLEFVTNTSVTKHTNHRYDVLSGYDGNITVLTNEVNYYENAGSESTATTNVDYNSADYLLMTADEINVQVIPLAWSSSGGSFNIHNDDPGELFLQLTGTLTAGTHAVTCAIIIDSADREGSAKAYTSANRLTLGNQYHDIASNANLATINSSIGSLITDLHIPNHIDEGVCSDGATHGQLDSTNYNLKLDINQSEIGRVDVLHEASIRTGTVGSETEHVKSFWDCDSTTLNIGTGSVTVTNATYTAAVIGNGVLIDASSETAYYQSSGNIEANQGTIEFDIKCTGTATANARFFQHSSATDEFELYWTNATTIAGNINGTAISFTVKDPLDGVKHHVKFTWDVTNDVHTISIDGEVQAIITTAVTAPTFSSGNIYIGNSSAGTNPINGWMDNWIVCGSVVHDYGTMIPGQITSGDVSYDYSHSTITLYSDDGSTLDIGTTSVTNIANISASEGTVLIALDVSTPLTADETLFSAGDSNTLDIKYVHASTRVDFIYNTDTVSSGTVVSGLDGKHIIAIRYKASDSLELLVDGVSTTQTTGVDAAPTLDTAITWSSNVGMTRKSISSSKGIPLLPCANWVPAHAPLYSKNGTLQQMGVGHDIVWRP